MELILSWIEIGQLCAGERIAPRRRPSGGMWAKKKAQSKTHTEVRFRLGLQLANPLGQPDKALSAAFRG